MLHTLMIRIHFINRDVFIFIGCLPGFVKFHLYPLHKAFRGLLIMQILSSYLL